VDDDFTLLDVSTHDKITKRYLCQRKLICILMSRTWEILTQKALLPSTSKAHATNVDLCSSRFLTGFLAVDWWRNHLHGSSTLYWGGATRRVWTA